jgi:glycosyltransferase involved in cell wall biosynthesis
MGITLSVVAVGNSKQRSTDEFAESAKEYFGSFLIVENVTMLKQFILSRSEKETGSVFLFMDLEKYVYWLLKNQIKFRGVFMRPYLEGCNLRSYLIWLTKRVITFLSHLTPAANIRLLAIPFQREKKTKKAWIRDDLTLRKIISSINAQQPGYDERFKEAIVVPGYLDTRKGISIAVKSFQHSQILTDEKLNLLFIGKATSNFLDDFLNLHEDSITLEDRYLSDHEFVTLLFSSRVIVLPYSNRGASGIVIEALVLGTPIVIVGRRTWRNLSVLCGGLVQFSRSNPKAISRAILRGQTLKRESMKKILEQEELTGISEFFLRN